MPKRPSTKKIKEKKKTFPQTSMLRFVELSVPISVSPQTKISSRNALPFSLTKTPPPAIRKQKRWTRPSRDTPTRPKSHNPRVGWATQSNPLRPRNNKKHQRVRKKLQRASRARKNLSKKKKDELRVEHGHRTARPRQTRGT